ncbi:MAG: hypothetical protein ABI067_17620 [Leifsonia sp.]
MTTMATDNTTEDLKTAIDEATAEVVKADDDLNAKLVQTPVAVEPVAKPKGYNQATGEFVL